MLCTVLLPLARAFDESRGYQREQRWCDGRGAYGKLAKQRRHATRFQGLASGTNWSCTALFTAPRGAVTETIFDLSTDRTCAGLPDLARVGTNAGDVDRDCSRDASQKLLSEVLTRSDIWDPKFGLGLLQGNKYEKAT